MSRQFLIMITGVAVTSVAYFELLRLRAVAQKRAFTSKPRAGFITYRVCEKKEHTWILRKRLKISKTAKHVFVYFKGDTFSRGANFWDLPGEGDEGYSKFSNNNPHQTVYRWKGIKEGKKLHKPQVATPHCSKVTGGGKGGPTYQAGPLYLDFCAANCCRKAFYVVIRGHVYRNVWDQTDSYPEPSLKSNGGQFLRRAHTYPDFLHQSKWTSKNYFWSGNTACLEEHFKAKLKTKLVVRKCFLIW